MAVRVYLDDPDLAEEDAMQFRLTYEGPLLADNTRGGRNPLRATDKQRIRKIFHRQLRRAWEVFPALNGEGDGPTLLAVEGSGIFPHDRESLAERFSRFGYRFVPIATRNLGLLVGLDILFLRADPPGSVIHAGDIDNRVKTLVDALKLPREASEVGSFAQPDADEDPFFVLMEDDSLVSRLAVETDTLLEPIKGEQSDARVIITVNVRPYRAHIENLQFA